MNNPGYKQGGRKERFLGQLRDPFNRRACWTTYYELGRSLNETMPKFATLEQVGARFGLTKQNAYTASVLALGKLAWLARQQVKAAVRRAEQV